MAEIRYLKITLVDGTRFILRVTSESPHFLHGFEVNAEGDEIVPAGYERRQHTIERALIKKAVEMRMSKKYATLVLPGQDAARVRIVNGGPMTSKLGWTRVSNKHVSNDKRFVIFKARKGYNLIDLDTYNEYPKPTLADAKVKAFDIRFAKSKR